jgi:hypothetical protein
MCMSVRSDSDASVDLSRDRVFGRQDWMVKLRIDDNSGCLGGDFVVPNDFDRQESG